MKRLVGRKPSESGNNTHFQRHSCPGPDFKAEKAKNALFNLKIPPKKGIFAIFIQSVVNLSTTSGHFLAR